MNFIIYLPKKYVRQSVYVLYLFLYHTHVALIVLVTSTR